MRQNRLTLYIVISVLLHVLLLLIFASGLMKFSLVAPPETQAETTLTLLQDTPPPPTPSIQAPPKQTSHFIPTLASQEADKANPNTPLESERNTQLRSDSAPRNANSPLPDMRGDPRQGLSYLNRPNSPGQGQQQPAAASQAKPQQTAQQQKAPQQQQPPQQQPTPDQQQAQTTPQPTRPPQPPAPRSEDALPVLPPEPKPAQQVTQQNSPPPQPASQASAQQSPRPPPASFAMARSDTVGGAGMRGMPSPEARDTELGRYKQKMYRAVGSRWYLKTESSMSFLAIGQVRIKFFVRSNGVLENVRIVEDSGRGNNSTEMLRTISQQSVIESAPFEPFSETMKQQLGDGYEEEFTFSIY